MSDIPWMLVGIGGILGLLAAAGAGLYLAYRLLRSRGVQRCWPSYVQQWPRRRCPRPEEPVHLLLCFADHYEPKFKKPSPEVARQRVQTWVETYPRQFARFRDSDGRPPRYTFFFPSEEYEPEYLAALAELCRAGYGEVEIHLHHHMDTAAALRQNLREFRDTLVQEHGLLARRRDTGEIAYGFIHGNWTLCDWHGNGRNCGVPEELDILRETGCYADFTMPSAPSITQAPRVNRMYYARNLPGQPRSHEQGVNIGTGPAPPDSLLLIPGPLVLDWKNRKRVLVPSLENGCVQQSQPASVARLSNWLRARVQVPQRPDWYFVKLHMHGAPENAHEVLLGEPMVRFHEDLARLARDRPNFHVHYVTAREMYNLARAAEAGWQGTVNDARDYQLLWNGGMPAASPKKVMGKCGT